ncbi:MAG: DUF975 family protein, partial [Faecalibacillus sp.]
MRIFDIKNKANSLLFNYEKIFKVFIYIGLINVLISIVSHVSSLISIFLSILTLTIGHGYVVSSLKTVNNMQDQIEPVDDALVGFTKIKKLFPTYFIYQLILTVIVIAICFIAAFIVFIAIGKENIQLLFQLFATYGTNMTLNSTQLLQMEELISNGVEIVLIFALIIVFVSLIYSLQFGLYPYVLEKYDIKGIAALKESSRLMKGNKWTLFKLQLSFIGWIILASLVVGLLSNVIGTFIP